MSDQGHCPRCGGVFEPGYVLHNSPGGLTRLHWFRGAPVWGPWFGVKFRGVPSSPVTTYRCTACGYLEPYAPDGPSAARSSARPCHLERTAARPPGARPAGARSGTAP